MRWIIGTFIGLAALTGVAVAVLYLLPADRIARIASDRFEAATGRAMILSGDVRPTLWPEIGVTAGPVSIANADWSDAGPMLTAERLAIGVAWGAVLGGDIRITRIEAIGPDILLERAADGRGNWQTALAAAVPVAGETAGAGAVPAITLDGATLREGRIAFVDHGAGTRIEMSAIEAGFSLADFAGRAEIDLEGRLNGQPVSLSGGIDDLAAFLGAGAVPVSLNAGASGASLAFEGRAGLSPPQAGGRIDAIVPDLAALLTALGQTAPDLPAGLGPEARVAGEVTFTGAGLTLRDGTLGLGDTTLTGALDVTLAGRPRLVAQVRTGALDLSALAGADADSSADASAGPARLDASALDALDAEIAIEADSVDLGLATLGRTALRTSLDQGRAVTEIRELQGLGGTTTGQVVVNGRDGFSVSADLDIRGVEYGPLLAEHAGVAGLELAGDVALDVLASGDTLAALTDSLRGSVTLRNGRARYQGNAVSGTGTLTLGDRPRLTAELSAGALDLGALTGAAAAGGGGSGPGWSTARIDVGALHLLDAEIALGADSIDLGLARLGRTELRTTLESGRAVTEIRRLAAYDGAASGTLVVNGRGGLSVRADLDVAGVALRPLLRQLAGYDRLTAPGDLRLNLLAAGNDMNALMHSLSGTGSVALGQGELAGLDLMGMLRTLDVGHVGPGSKTIFRSVKGSFRVENGVLQNDDLALDAPLLTATGSGRVGIGAQTLSYRIVPRILEGRTEGGLSVPLLVTGSWAAPRFKLDLQGLAREALKDGVRDVKAEVQSEVKDRLSEELGITPGAGESVQDAVRDEVQGRARKGLRDAVRGR